MSRDRYMVINPNIAKWKISCFLESWLSFKADHSELWKRIYVLFYAIFDRRYYIKGLKIIESKLQERNLSISKDMKSLIVRDMIYSLHRFGADYDDYLIYNFINLSPLGREKWVTDKLRYGYDTFLTDKEIVKLVEDKYKCYLHFKEYYKRDCIGCYTNMDFNNYIAFIKKYPIFVYKPLCGYGGKGFDIIDSTKIEPKTFFQQMIQNGGFILEEKIIQHPDVACIHPSSVNTVRILTFVIKNKVNFVAASFRFGTSGSIVDNRKSGGYFTSIDIKSGILICKAVNSIGESILRHPDTNIVLPGFKMPKWDDLLSMVEDAALRIKDNVLTSWDVAYSDKGWSLVEVNTGGGWWVLQTAQNEPLKEKLYSYIDKLDVKNE